MGNSANDDVEKVEGKLKHHKKKGERAGSHSKRQHSRKLDEDDFYTNQLVNDLVGVNEEITSSANASIMTAGREDVKHSESNTTNHSTGDSQNSSSAEKEVDTRKLLSKDHHQACSSGSSSQSSEDEAAICVPNESLRSFITDSPFSFRNPIFFSVPRDQ
jgi:hypothetical protein